MNEASNQGGKTFVNQILQAYRNQNQQAMTNTFKQLYKTQVWNASPRQWEVSVSMGQYDDGSDLFNSFSKMLDLVRKYQATTLKNGIVPGFKMHMEVLSSALKVFESIKSEDYVWICKPVRQVVRATKAIFLQASKQVRQIATDITVKKDDLVNSLQRYKTSREINPQIKKQIVPLIDNLQVSIMLVYHNYEQIRRILESNKSYGEHGKNFEDNYYFQRGKAALINEKMAEAEQFFTCINIRTSGQKRLVLKYLIPCRIFLGKMFEGNPDDQTQNFPQYQPIISSLINANFQEYDNAINKYQKLWIKRGIYLVMDQLRIIVWRNLLKKVHRVMGDKLNFDDIRNAVELSKGRQQMGQIVCIVSNLIHDGYIKGYIFHDEGRKFLVLKKGGQAFPHLSKIYS